jgi:hypothetical protein
MNRIVPLLFPLLLFFCVTDAQVKRAREEGITDVIASNTMGFGNIWVRSSLSAAVMSDGGRNVEPYQAIGLGLSNNLSAWAGAVPFEGGFKRLLGKADAHVKATLPYNDNLRLLGLAIQGDIILSTEMDTLSQGQDTARPAFTPKLGVTISGDVDLIKKFKRLPLKLYVNWATIDNDRLLVMYEQQSYRFGMEYKGERHSYFLGMKYGRYKLRPRGSEVAADAGYDENLLLLMPGVRYRVLNRFSVLGTAFFAASGTVKANSPLKYPKFAFQLGLEFPLYFRETNAEAIRAMIFLENRKQTPEEKAATVKTVRRNNDFAGLLMPEDPKESQALNNALKSEDIPLDREDQLKEKRKKINEELNSIEKLLE